MAYEFRTKHTPQPLSDQDVNEKIRDFKLGGYKRVTVCEWKTSDLFEWGVGAEAYYANIECREFGNPGMLEDHIKQIRRKRDDPNISKEYHNEERREHQIVGVFSEPVIGPYKLIPSFIRKIQIQMS